MRFALRSVDEIVHLAAEVGVGQSMYEISRYVDANSAGTGVLLDVLANEKHQVHKIVVASSMSIYGEGAYVCPQDGSTAPRLRPVAQLADQHWEPSCAKCSRRLLPVPTPETKPLYPSTATSMLTSCKQHAQQAGDSVTYSFDSGDVFICTGDDPSGNVYYERGVIGPNTEYLLTWGYPVADKAQYDPLLEHSMATFRPGPL